MTCDGCNKSTLLSISFLAQPLREERRQEKKPNMPPSLLNTTCSSWRVPFL